MRRIGLFIAGSRVEFEAELDEVFDFLRSLNDALVSTGQIIRVRTGRREPAPRSIPESARFYLFMGASLAEPIRGEFDAAWESFQAQGHPLITVYLRDLEESRLDERARAFKAHIAEDLSHYYATFSHLDTVKLGMLLDLAELWGLQREVSLRDGIAFLGQDEVFSVEDAPFYANRSQIVHLKERLEELDAEYERVRDSFNAEGDGALLRRLEATKRQREDVAERLHELESSLLDLFELIGNRDVEETSRTIEASRYLEEGDYEAALDTLSSRERRRDLIQGKKLREAGRALVRGYISEERMKIGILLTQIAGPEDVDEVKGLYADLCDVALEEDCDTDVLLDYASFLVRENELPGALDYVERYLGNLRRNDPDSMTYPAKLIEAEVYTKLHRLREAREAYEALIEDYRALAEDDPISYDRQLARCLRDDADICMKLKYLPEAEAAAREALDLFRELARGGDDEARNDLASAMLQLAVILRRYDDPDPVEVDGLYRGALEIVGELKERDPGRYRASYAWIANNSAVYLGKLPETAETLDRAERLFREALDIRGQLAQADPGAHLTDEAWTACCYGTFLKDRERYPEAEAQQMRSLSLRRELAKFDADEYDSHVAWTLNCLAGLYATWGRLRDAESYHRQALDIYDRLVYDKSKRYFLPKIAWTYEHFAPILEQLGNTEEAEALSREAERIREEYKS